MLVEKLNWTKLTEMSKKQQRPVYLNLFKIRLPITGVVSIAHRISGVLLVLFLPLGIYLLDKSLTTKEGFQEVGDWFVSPFSKALILIGVWALSHHLFTGIRFLLIDIQVGTELKTARFSAWVVGIAAIAVTLFIGGRWLL